jgi:hypothetical protein
MLIPGNIPAVQLVGEVDHPDFRDVIELLRTESRLITSAETPPELIVVAHSRPDVICAEQLHLLRRAAPISGIVALLGSWCEGETRTGRPWPGVGRLYWYEFATWWRRQTILRAAGRCPDWSRPANHLSLSEPGRPRPRPGVIVLRTPQRDTADALADVCQHAGYSTAWQPAASPRNYIRGVAAGIWDGGQLSDTEAADLRQFCSQLARCAAPVLTLLDFPRRDRVDQANEIGTAAVLGKPYLNCDLLAALETITVDSRRAYAA